MPRLDDSTALPLMIAGLAITAIGFLWLVVRAFRTGTGWGILSLVPGLNLIFVIVKFGRAWLPLLVMLIGGAVVAAPVVMNALAGEQVSDQAKVEVKLTNGGTEERITLTSANPTEYAILREKKTFAVIQWANKDVTDEHIELLRGMDQLRELDLNGSSITDKSLAVIATLPKLESLRIGCAGITDDGFRQHILPLQNLQQLDLTGSKVKRSTASEWTNARPGRVRPNL